MKLIKIFSTTFLYLLAFSFYCSIPSKAEYTLVSTTTAGHKFYVDKDNISCSKDGICNAYIFLSPSSVSENSILQWRRFGQGNQQSQFDTTSLMKFYCLQHTFSTLSANTTDRNGNLVDSASIINSANIPIGAIYPGSAMAIVENVVCSKTVGFKPLQ